MATFTSLLKNSSRFSLSNLSSLLKNHYSSSTSTVDSEELNKFSLSVQEWWNDVRGPAAPLHSMNSVRIPFIKEALLSSRGVQHGEEMKNNGRPLEGYSCLDVGCGGGILCESLGKLGASVKGIDPNLTAIQVARQHLIHTNTYSLPGIIDTVSYQCISIENLVNNGNSSVNKGDTSTVSSLIKEGNLSMEKEQEGENRGDISTTVDSLTTDVTNDDTSNSKEGENNEGSVLQYDCVIASEVLEHVSNVRDFISHVYQLVKPGGAAVFSTLNRTLSSLLLAKMTAEYILQIVPPGTHDWNKFITPIELECLLVETGFSSIKLQGLAFNPFTYNWSYCNDTSLNYCMYAIKQQ